MPKIKQLSAHEAQKIASGQVVERPANIVKELVENSLDAHASTIEIYIESGGKKLIRVVDNGDGMSCEDAQLCFLKHATSKISSIDELTAIHTFGFRGEALASMAAVARVTLTTREPDTPVATRITAQDSILSTPSEMGSPPGTDIAIQDLFYAIPARAKFLKKTETEWRQILQLVQAFCLAFPQAHFRLFTENKCVLNCPPVKALETRWSQIWTQTTQQTIITLKPVSYEQKGFSLAGILGNHMTSRYDRQNIFLFVNNRWVKNHQLASAVCKGYTNVLAQGKYPVAALQLTIDPDLVDINTHPRKEEVKFANPRVIERAIEQSVRTCLEEHLAHAVGTKKTAAQSKTFFTSDSTSFTQPQSPASSFQAFNFDQLQKTGSAQNVPIPALKSEPRPDIKSQFHSTPTQEEQASIPTEQGQTTLAENLTDDAFQIIGQLHKTYILLEQSEGLFVIDQHAAHERILYEQFVSRFKELPSVQLLFPVRVTLPTHEIELIESYCSILSDHGIQAERCGPQQLLFTATPAHIKHINLQDLAEQLVSWLKESQEMPEEELFNAMHKKLRAQMACKAAVKAGDELTQEKMIQLVTDLMSSPNRFCCPHGRPTGWLFHQYDIEKKFKRRL